MSLTIIIPPHSRNARTGGPLVRTGSDYDSDLLGGLVSWGFSCADSNFPGVYSRLSSFFVDFLRPAICEYSASPPEYLECHGSDNSGNSGGGGFSVPTTPSTVVSTGGGAYDESIPAPSPVTGIVYDEFIPTPSPESTTDLVYDESVPTPLFGESIPLGQPTDFQTPAGEVPQIYNQPAPASPVLIPSPDYTLFPAPNDEEESNAFTFTPVTGSITCQTAGMACTIKCSNCASIKRVALAMDIVLPDEYTIVYTTERGTDEYPDDPSRLIVVGTETTAADEISCDEGCTCSSVNDSVLGCGLVAQPTILAPHPTLNDALNRGVYAGMSRCLMPVVLVLLFCLR